MVNLEPAPGFYENYGYREYEKKFLHHATVSILNIFTYNINVILWNKSNKIFIIQ